MGRKFGYLLVLFMAILLAACGSAPTQQGTQGSRPGATTATTPTALMASPVVIAGHKATPTAAPTRPPKPKQTPPPGNSSGPPPTSSQESQLTQRLFALINSDRAKQGLPAYTWNATMANGARLHSWNMAHCGLSHACPGEPAPCQRVSNEGIQWTACGENVGYTSPSPDAWTAVQGIERAMLNEQPPNDGHRRNLLSTAYHRVGVGIYIDSKGLIWITEDFAS